jgi:DNA modification methylase
MELNKIYNENCLETMARMPDGFLDLVVTSPSYDDLRVYNGYSFDFEAIAKELFRVVKIGGVVVWVVGDATKDGSELVYDPFMGSGTTAKMAHLQNRRWIGSEISAEYADLAGERLQLYLSQGG